MKIVKPRLIRVSYFAWMLPFAAAYAIFTSWGTPHLLIEWKSNNWRSQCGYLGPTGGHLRYRSGRSCPWFLWVNAPSQEGRGS